MVATQDIVSVTTDNQSWSEAAGEGSLLTIHIELQHVLDQEQQWILSAAVLRLKRLRHQRAGDAELSIRVHDRDCKQEIQVIAQEQLKIPMQ